jgi:hypothetical protein
MAPDTYALTQPSRDAVSAKKITAAAAYVSVNGLYLITLFLTCKRTSEIVAVLLVLSVVNATYAGVLWGATRRTVDGAMLRDHSVDFAFHTAASVFNALFTLQLLRVASLPTYVAVQNAGPFVSHALLETVRRSSLLRDSFKPEQQKAGLIYLAGLALYCLPAAITSLLGSQSVASSLSARVGWSLLSLAAVAVRQLTTSKLPTGVSYETLHATEHTGAFLFSMVYILTFKAFDEQMSVDVNRAANYLTLSALLSLLADVSTAGVHAYNRSLGAAESAGASFPGATIAFHELTLGTRAAVLAFSFVTLIPFDGSVALFMVGHMLMAYAAFVFVAYQRDDRTVIDLLDMASSKAAVCCARDSAVTPVPDAAPKASKTTTPTLGDGGDSF